MTLSEQLRDACDKVRLKSYPLSDLIPLMQQAADALDAQVKIAHGADYKGVALLPYIAATGGYRLVIRHRAGDTNVPINLDHDHELWSLLYQKAGPKSDTTIR